MHHHPRGHPEPRGPDAGVRSERAERVAISTGTLFVVATPLGNLETIREVSGETPPVVARELTKQFEDIVTTTPSEHLARLTSGPIRGEFTLVSPAASATGAAADDEQ